MDWHFPRSVYSIGLMCSAAAERGVAVEHVLAGSGISSSALSDPSTEVLPRQELIVISNIAEQIGDQDGIGLEIGAPFHISAYGVLAFALASCSTLRELIDLGNRYSQLAFALTDRCYEENSGKMHIIFQDNHLPEAIRSIVVERDLAALVNIGTELFFLPLPIETLSLRQPQPAYAELFLQHLGVEPTFGAAQNAIIVDAEVLDLPLPQANPQALQYWDTQLQAILRGKQERTGTAGKVRTILSRNPGVAPDMEAIGAELCTTSRNLRRQLAAEGTSFRALVDEFREALAEELLTTARLTVEQVAERLGYSEASSFTNAFRRWKGMPPQEWRSGKTINSAVRAQKDKLV